MSTETFLLVNVGCFLWGLVAGVIIERGLLTGRWSLLP